MKILELLTEAKARIEHPEDMILDGGMVGALAALESLKDAASSTMHMSIKFDGTPALIAGNINKKFVMTDKVGLAKQQFPKSAKEIYTMLFDRKPDQAGRSQYSSRIAALFPYIKQMIPISFQGLIQFDVMWLFDPPELLNGVYQFKPNKVLYSVPANTELGKQIGMSENGIVVHSYYKNPQDTESRAIEDFKMLGLQLVRGLVILNPKATFVFEPNKLIIKNIDSGIQFVKKYSAKIDTFVNQPKLKSLQISDLMKLIKQYVAYLAQTGQQLSAVQGEEFINWIRTLPITAKKSQRIIDYIGQNNEEYKVVWQILDFVVRIKKNLIKSLSQQKQDIQATINGESSHEGYVVDAPSGKIKLVNRPLFMKKDEESFMDRLAKNQ